MKRGAVPTSLLDVLAGDLAKGGGGRGGQTHGRRSARVPCPARRLSVEHPQLVVDALALRGRLLLLLRGQVTEHSVDGGDLHNRQNHG